MEKSKIKKFLFINIIVILIVLAIIEVCSYFTLCYKYKNDIINYLKITTGKDIKIPYIKYVMSYNPTKENLYNNFRPIEEKNTKKKPIILFGCSYTYGFGLDEKETFSKKLSDHTNRTVINRGKAGTGLPFLYYQLSDEEVLKNLPQNTEYIIYTLIPDHFPRMLRYRNWIMTGDYTLRYKLVNDKLVEDKINFPILHSCFTSVAIEDYLSLKNGKNRNKIDKLYFELMKQSYLKIKDNFPTAKFVVLYYEGPMDKPDSYNEEIKMLKKISNNIIFIRVRDEIPNINEKQYWLEDNNHPSALAWDKLIPIISKKLNL